jgi:hypothetical protein
MYPFSHLQKVQTPGACVTSAASFLAVPASSSSDAVALQIGRNTSMMPRESMLTERFIIAAQPTTRGWQDQNFAA